MKEEQSLDIIPLKYPYKIFLTEAFAPIYESVIKTLPLQQRTSLRVVDRTIGDLVTRKYKFVLSCTKKYEEYIKNYKLSEEKIDVWNEIVDTNESKTSNLFYYTKEEIDVLNKSKPNLFFYPTIEEL